MKNRIWQNFSTNYNQKRNMLGEDIKEILENYKEETKRHFDVVAERIEDKIEIFVLKLAIQFIKNELKQ